MRTVLPALLLVPQACQCEKGKRFKTWVISIPRAGKRLIEGSLRSGVVLLVEERIAEANQTIGDPVIQAVGAGEIDPLIGIGHGLIDLALVIRDAAQL